MRKIHSKNQIHLHIDADAFFASVEQVLHRQLRKKPIVIGQNGGIVTALSYPAKTLGISRVSPISTIRRKYPQVKIVASDFYAYGLFSKRMQNIIRKRFPHLVQNSIDEGSVDVSLEFETFEQARQAVECLQNELYVKTGCTFSFGIARTPLLAKLASGLNKPNGVTVLNDDNVRDMIYHLSADAISGIGKQSYKKLLRYGIKTIRDFVQADSRWLQFQFSVVMPAIQKQMRGEVVSIPKQKNTIKSMSRDRSFSATSDYNTLYSQMTANIEHLGQRMRWENVYTKRIGLRLRNQDLAFVESYRTLVTPTRDPMYLLSEFKKLLDELYIKNQWYRQVSVNCAELGPQVIQNDLFGEIKSSQEKDQVLEVMDDLERKFGKSCIGLASGIGARTDMKNAYARQEPDDVYPHPLLPGEEKQKRLAYPFLGLIS
jgi:nucleotidyltransferase/DNA polymerase involved in DNA repair